MNGVHDMGGMDGFGRVETEQNEPPFHEAWEGRVFGMQRSMGYAGAWHIDDGRYAQETLPPRTYLAASYYWRWMLGLEKNLLQRGFVTAEELAAGHAQKPARQVDRTLTADVVRAGMTRNSFFRPQQGPARFQPGDRVRTKNINPLTHTRLPRYARDKVGTVERIHGCHAFPDSVATDKGDDPQWLYTVVFDGCEVWGPDSDPTLTVSIDAFEPYLEPARTGGPGIPLPGIPRDADGPVFREPWEAQAFAMALALHARGVFTWPEWAATLSAEIKRAQEAGDPDTGSTYYRHWLNALERLVAEKGIADAATLSRYQAAWDHAADRTPHGAPIELKPEDFRPT